ncbi:MAG: AraC family transcriptional regulator [Christensenellaceae bacterium]
MEYELIKHLEGTSLKTFVVTINQRELHFHCDIEILLVLKGSVYIDDGMRRHLLKKDDIFISNRNEIHSLKRTNEQNLILVIQFDPDLCMAYYPQISQIKFSKKHLMGDDSLYWTELSQHMAEMVSCYTQKKDAYPIKMMAILNQILFCMIHYDCYTTLDEKLTTTQNKNMKRLSRILEYIQQNYVYPITLKEIAQTEKMDMYYLSHFIKAHLGISFQQYVNRIRVEKAEYLLLHTNLKYIDICMECGFSDYKYLKKAFEKEFGCPITAYKGEKDNVGVSQNSAQHIVMEVDKALNNLIQSKKKPL